MADKDFAELPAEEQQRIISRLFNIQAHIENNRNENEAANAATRLTEQLTRFNLTMADLNRRGNAKKIPYGLHIYQFRKTKEIRSKWKQSLLGTLCKFNGAYAITWGDSNYMKIVAEPHVYQIIVDMYESLIKRLAVLCDLRQMLSSRGQRWTPAMTIKFKTDWLIGAVDGIWLKLEERDNYIRQESRYTHALVVYREKELEDAKTILFKEADIKVSSARKNIRRASSAYKDGVVAGNRVELERPIRA